MTKPCSSNRGLGEQLGSYGKFVIHANGSYTYTPDARAQALNLNEHQQETFTFTVTDKAGNTAIETFQISLTGRNDGPVITNAVSDSQGATVEDGATRVSGQLSASDLDKGDQLSWEVVGSGSNPGTGNYGNLAVLPSTVSGFIVWIRALIRKLLQMVNKSKKHSLLG